MNRVVSNVELMPWALRTAETIAANSPSAVQAVKQQISVTGAEHARSRGVILADTKFELGLDEHGELVLGDEVLTPDSSRYWPAEGFEVGHGQPSFDKQYVRDWASQSGWDKQPPAPAIPDDVVAGTRARYVEAFERLTSIRFDDYVADPTIVLRER